MTRETAFHASVAKHTRNFVEYRGYWLANSFAKRWRRSTNTGPAAKGRGDHGPVAAAQVRGDRPRFRGAAAIHADPRRQEARRRPGRLFRHVLRAWRHDRRRHAASGSARTISAGSAATIFGGIWLREQAQKLGLKVLVRSSTDQMHNIAVQGPKSRDILREIIWTSPVQPVDRRARMVPLRRRPHRRRQGCRRSSSRAPAIPASSATRSGAIRATRDDGVRRGLGGRPAARR